MSIFGRILKPIMCWGEKLKIEIPTYNTEETKCIGPKLDVMIRPEKHRDAHALRKLMHWDDAMNENIKTMTNVGGGAQINNA
jgi:hypothetical protein